MSQAEAGARHVCCLHRAVTLKLTAGRKPGPSGKELVLISHPTPHDSERLCNYKTIALVLLVERSYCLTHNTTVASVFCISIIQTLR